MRRLTSCVLAFVFLLAQTIVVPAWYVGGGQLQGFQVGQNVVMHTSTCVSSTANGTTYSNLILTFATLSDSSPVTVIVGAIGEDGTATFGVSTLSMENAAQTEVVDEAGTGIVNTAIYRSTSPITGAASLDVDVTFTEAITSATVCGWAFENLDSVTPTSSVVDDDTASGALVLTLSSTTTGGFAVGVCTNSGVADATTWAVLTEREDTQHAEADYSNADAVTTGASMAVTCDWSGGNDASGAAVAVR